MINVIILGQVCPTHILKFIKCHIVGKPHVVAYIYHQFTIDADYKPTNISCDIILEEMRITVHVNVCMYYSQKASAYDQEMSQ